MNMINQYEYTFAEIIILVHVQYVKWSPFSAFLESGKLKLQKNSVWFDCQSSDAILLVIFIKKISGNRKVPSVFKRTKKLSFVLSKQTVFLLLFYSLSVIIFLENFKSESLMTSEQFLTTGGFSPIKKKQSKKK